MFNPFLFGGDGTGGSSGGTSEKVRYSVVKDVKDNIVSYKLQQNIDNVKAFVGDVIKFDAKDISYNSETWKTIEQVLNYLVDQADGNYYFTTFEELGINTVNLSMEDIAIAVGKLHLPVNTIITGQIYQPALPLAHMTNAEAEIQITRGVADQQILWSKVTSLFEKPYAWNGIYYSDKEATTGYTTLPWTAANYELPIASDSTLGGVKIGEGLKISEDGVLSIDGVSGNDNVWYGTYNDFLAAKDELKDGTYVFITDDEIGSSDRNDKLSSVENESYITGNGISPTIANYEVIDK